jgi:hypothetical protein
MYIYISIYSIHTTLAHLGNSTCSYKNFVWTFFYIRLQKKKMYTILAHLWQHHFLVEFLEIQGNACEV